MSKRENGTGTIYCRKYVHRTAYIAYAPARYVLVDGKAKVIREKLGSFPSKKLAREALEAFNRHPTPKYNFTLSDVYEDWKPQAFADLKPQTVTSWTTSWAKIKSCTDPQLADKLIREITTGEIRQLLDYYATEQLRLDDSGQIVTTKPLSKSYITKIKALMTQLFDHAIINNIVDRNYASLVKTPKMEAGTIRAMTDAEFERLTENWKTAPGGDACLVLCYTGFRVSEFCQLTRSSYDPEAKTLTGGMKTEAGTNRTVPVHHVILPIIERWYTDCIDHLYPRPDGKAYTKDTFAKGVWRPCMKSLGLPDDLTPHSARHTFGTRMAAAGARPEDIQRMLGHADYSMTANVYINQDVSALRHALDLLG